MALPGLMMIPSVMIGLGVLLIVIAVIVAMMLRNGVGGNMAVRVNGRRLSDAERASAGPKLAWWFGGIMGGIGALFTILGVILVFVFR